MITLAKQTNEQTELWRVTKTGLELTGDLTFEDCRLIVDTLAAADTSVKLALGDAIIYARTHFGQQYVDLLDGVQFSPGYIYNIVYVCTNVPAASRTYRVSFSHLYEVASRPAEEQLEWLQMSVDRQWSRETLRSAMKGNLLAVNEEPSYVMPVNDRSAIYTVLAWLDGKYLLSKQELRKLLEDYLNESEGPRKEGIPY